MVVLAEEVEDDVEGDTLDLVASLALVWVVGFVLAGAWHTTESLGQSQLFAVCPLGQLPLYDLPLQVQFMADCADANPENANKHVLSRAVTMAVFIHVSFSVKPLYEILHHIDAGGHRPALNLFHRFIHFSVCLRCYTNFRALVRHKTVDVIGFGATAFEHVLPH